MKNISVLLKENLNRLPYSIGKFLAFIPFGKRPGIGDVYNIRTKEIDHISSLSISEKKAFIFERVKKVVDHAYGNTKFYREYYDQCTFHPDDLQSFNDLEKIPIVNKSLMQSYSIEDRSCDLPGRYVVNTGGSSGKPLSLYILPNSMGHEWAHMHTIWKKIGYRIQDLKISFGGRTVGDKILEYDSVRHSYNFNIYYDLKKHKADLLKFFKSRNVKFLHGYPSAIYEFSLFCTREENEDLLKLVRKRISGVFFGSEFPIEKWRHHIESAFDAKSVSWYGHTERAVLAYEKEEQYTYYPFETYGFSEVVNLEGKDNLISTSYYNFASPLIRYNTEDIVDPLNEDGLLKCFKVSEGRIGEFVLDFNSNKIGLTGLIFGRHHKLFDVCSHIQVRQTIPGEVVILYTPLENKDVDSPESLFDSEGIDINVSFEQLESPIKTQSGKVKLLVK